jgi:hypothetical protein
VTTPQVLGASRSFFINGPVAAFGYAAGFKSMASSGAARLAQQLVALKQLTPAASRLLLRCVHNNTVVFCYLTPLFSAI